MNEIKMSIPMATLKAFQVGDNDIVAHYSPAEAVAFLCDNCGYSENEFTVDDVFAVSDSLLDVEMFDEDDISCGTLRKALAAAKEPCVLHGWE